MDSNQIKTDETIQPLRIFNLLKKRPPSKCFTMQNIKEGNIGGGEWSKEEIPPRKWKM